MSFIVESLMTQTATWFVGLVITVLTVFSSYLSEKIKFHLNKADIRTKHHQELLIEISGYIFVAEISVEFIENGWTSKKILEGLISDYNEPLVNLRKKEYLYLAWLNKYWAKKEVKCFEDFMESLKIFDTSIHNLNDEFEAIIYNEKEKIDLDISSQAIKNMKPELKKLKRNGRLLLEAL